MLEAIRSATQTIAFETYIYWSGDIGRRFAEALTERARAGVAVHLLVDWAGGGKMDDALIAQMAGAGVEFLKFHPLRWYHLARWKEKLVERLAELLRSQL